MFRFRRAPQKTTLTGAEIVAAARTLEAQRGNMDPTDYATLRRIVDLEMNAYLQRMRNR